MSLDTVRSAIEAVCPVRDDVATEGNTFRLTSGGVAESLFQEPAFWASDKLACEAFRDQALAFLKAKNAVGHRMLDGPHLDKWQITVTDAKHTHRIAEPRWSVTCKIAIFTEAAQASQAA